MAALPPASRPSPSPSKLESEVAAKLESELRADQEVTWGEVCVSCCRHTPSE